LIRPASAGEFTCVGVIASNLNSDVFVPAGATCVVDADVNGNFKVYGALVLLDGRRIDGNIELFDGVLNAQTLSRIKGDIKANSQVELSGARVEGNVIFESPGGLEFSNGETKVWGNLEFKATTNVSGAGNATIFGNAKCEGNVIDTHVGVIATTGNKEGCPAGF
jgi:hypothetical protein